MRFRLPSWLFFFLLLQKPLEHHKHFLKEELYVEIKNLLTDLLVIAEETYASSAIKSVHSLINMYIDLAYTASAGMIYAHAQGLHHPGVAS